MTKIPVDLQPIFVGNTEDGERIVLYKQGEVIHILRPDKELWALSPGSMVTSWDDPATMDVHVNVDSPEWSGTARGNPQLLHSESVVVDYSTAKPPEGNHG